MLNKKLREGLSKALDSMDVSSGRSIAGAVKVADLVNPDRIGGAKDDRIALSQRVIILTEASQAGGGMKLAVVRRKILDAYTNRSNGLHPLAFCNDLVRYYRTVCIDYKAKSGLKKFGWAEQNVKLRHSRKFWYFASVLSAARVGETCQLESASFAEGLLEKLELPPMLRLFEAAGVSARSSIGRVLDHYAWYLDFMSDSVRRQALNSVDHADRYAVGDNGVNPYAALQWNLKVLHSEILGVLEHIDRGVRDRVVEWFLL